MLKNSDLHVMQIAQQLSLIERVAREYLELNGVLTDFKTAIQMVRCYSKHYEAEKKIEELKFESKVTLEEEANTPQMKEYTKTVEELLKMDGVKWIEFA
jgi:glutamate mutase epsilon subunit